MKKVYEKPYVYVESFEVSQHIASCDFNIRGSQSVENCYAVESDDAGYETGGAKIFMVSGMCDVTTEEYCNYNSVQMGIPTSTSY